MPPAVDRSKLPRACDPGPEASGLSTASHSVSSTRGTPARTCRGRSTRPCACGAGLTTDGAAPGQRAVRAAYRSPASPVTSSGTRPDGSPWRAASTAKPITRTDPVRSMRTFSGTRRPCETPAACATSSVPATSPISQAARRGDSGPSSASRMSSETPVAHSLTTKQRAEPSRAVWSEVSSTSRTRNRRRSTTRADVRAASRSRPARSSSARMMCTATDRSSEESCAR